MSYKQKQRTQHYLRPNHGTEVPRNLCFVDVKSAIAPDANKKDTELHRLDFGVADAFRWQNNQIERWQRLTFVDHLGFWSWLHSRLRTNTSMWLVGHGIARIFTMLQGWRLLQAGSFRLTPHKQDAQSQPKHDEEAIANEQGWLVDNDPPTILLLYGPGYVIHVVDVQNYGPATVEELAQSAGVELLPNPGPDGTRKRWENYLTRRVLALRKYFTQMMAWWKANDLGQWRHTVASLAMSAFRHKFLAAKILIHTCEDALKEERAALVGGEFTNFYCGTVGPYQLGAATTARRRRDLRRPGREGPVYVYDCNSLYPAVMMANKFPQELIAPKRPAHIDDLLHWRKTLLLIARVQVETKLRRFPYLHDGQRYWCVGKFWTTICGPELDAAIDEDLVRDVESVYAYLPGRLFKDYVPYFYDMRRKAAQAGDKAQERYAKLLLNCLAGKWGQRQMGWDFVKYKAEHPLWGSWAEVNADNGEVRSYRAIAGDVQIQMIGQEGLQSAPAIEAFINSYAREAMRSVRIALPPSCLLYQGCDSLHILEHGNEAIRPFLESYPGELGKMRLHKVIQEAEYRGPQDYTLDGQLVVSGINPDLKPSATGEYAQEQTQSLRSILTREPSGVVKVKQVKVTREGYHPRGILNEDSSVSPPQVFGPSIHFERAHPLALPFDPSGIGK